MTDPTANPIAKQGYPSTTRAELIEPDEQALFEAFAREIEAQQQEVAEQSAFSMARLDPPQSVATADSLIPAFEDLLEAVDLANADAVQVGSRVGQDAYTGFDTPVKAAGRLSLALKYTTGSIEYSTTQSGLYWLT